MLNKKIAEMLNDQINKELYSAYLYLDFANYYADEGLDGFAHWYEVQAQEERDHAFMIRRYLINNGIRVEFKAIDKPESSHAFGDRLRARTICYLFDNRDLSRGIRAKGLQNHAIPRLVHQGTGRRGD